MNYISFEYIIFIFLVMAIYFGAPLKIRYVVLLAASLYFYWKAGWQKLIFLGIAGLVTYVCGLTIWYLRNPKFRKVKERKKASDFVKNDLKQPAFAVLLTGILLLLSMLIYAKTGERLVHALSGTLHGKGLSLSVIVPLGVSYYTLAAIGYLADVYWKKDIVEKNPLKILLYLVYFPQIAQGPIPKHKDLGQRLVQGHRFEYERVCFGLQRVLWGLFKKLVIADRLAVMTSHVIQNYSNYSGFIFLLALAGAVFQLYTDFSGCVDIALGVSQVFGVPLEENFNRPFYSTSSAEFWRRWHISLGSWFKDYVYMPISASAPLITFGKYVKKHMGRTTARNIMTTIPLLTVWLLTGLWHGTGWDYLIWGLYWGCIITISTWLAPVYKKINTKLGLNDQPTWWCIFRRYRTFGIYMVGRLITLPGNLMKSYWIGRKIFTWNPWVLFDGTIIQLGWSYRDAWIAFIGLGLVWKVSSLQEKGIHIRETVAKWPLPLRWAFYYGAIFAVLVFGLYGNGVSTPAFVYMNY